MLELFPDSAQIDDGALSIGGLTAAELVGDFGSPLVVYDEATMRAQARAYRGAAPDAFIAYGTKAFPNVAILRLLAEEGIGADVSTLGELRFAQAAGIPGDRLVVHGNNKSDEELAAAAKLNALVVVDSLEEIERAHEAGVMRTLIRFTPGIEANTHEAIRTAHHGSKFGLPANDVIEALKQAQDTEGLHIHIGSQLLDLDAALQAVDWLATFAARARSETGWYPRTIDLGGGLGARTAPRRARNLRRGIRRQRPRRARTLLHVAGAATTAGDTRAGSVTRRAGGCDALLHRRLGQARRVSDDLRRGRRRHVRQPPPGALRRAPTPPCSRTVPGSRRPTSTPSPASTANRATC